jgi:hypothetical protein
MTPSSADLAWARSIMEDPQYKVPGGFYIRRWTVNMDSDGMAVLTHEDIHAEGAVTPAGTVGAYDVVRTPTDERQSDAIVVYTSTPIQTGDVTGNTVADHILYDDASWKVTDQNGWLQWGFNTATATLLRPGEVG